MRASAKYEPPSSTKAKQLRPPELIDGVPMIDVLAEDGALSFLVQRLALTDGGGAPHMIAGSGFSGKSVLCQDLLLSLAAGVPALGSLRLTPSRVLHVDLEQGARLTRRRYRRLALAKGIDLGALQSSGRLAIACLPSLSLAPEHRSRWLSIMARRDLVLVDSLRVAAFGLDENKSGFRDAIDFLTSLSEETGCRVLLIHHVRKRTAESTSRMHEMLRGSSAIFEALDCVWILNGEDGEEGKELVNVKARSSGETVAPLLFTIADVAGPGDGKWGLRAHVASIEKLYDRRRAATEAKIAADERAMVGRLLDTVGLYPGLTAEELALRMHVRKQTTILAILNAGSRLQLVRDEATGGRPRQGYRLAP